MKKIWKVLKVSTFISGVISNLIVAGLIVAGCFSYTIWQNAPSVQTPDDLVMVETYDKSIYYSEQDWLPEEYKSCLVLAIPGIGAAKVFCNIEDNDVEYKNHAYVIPIGI